MKNKNIEMKIYELLGIKIFRKMAFGLYKILNFPFTIFMSKEKRKNFYELPNNYKMKKGNGLQDLRDFKKMLLLNASLHAGAMCWFLPDVIEVFKGELSVLQNILIMSATVINGYCIMLQRYNWIRIDRVLKKGEARDIKKKNVICEELKKDKEIVNSITYTIVNKKDKEKIITFDDFLENASLEQLKEYKKHLEIMKNNNMEGIYIPFEKGKILKLEIKTRTK